MQNNTNDNLKPLSKIELTALILFSAVMFYLVSQVFLLAQKNSPQVSASTIKQVLENTNNIPQIDSFVSSEVTTSENSSTNTSSGNTHSLDSSVVEPKNLESIIQEPTQANNSGDPADTDTDTEIANTNDHINVEQLRAAELKANAKAIQKLCESIDNKLGSVDLAECTSAGLIHSGAVSNENRPLAYRDFKTDSTNEKTRIMLIGGIHGDEFSGVSISFKWLHSLLNSYANETGKSVDDFHWRVIPILNPDGLLQSEDQSTRMNANEVDLNRNFPTPDWDELAHKFWVEKRYSDKRRYPGPSSGSEIETQWIVNQLEEFQPHAVISIHAPYGILDADGPIEPPPNVGPLKLKLLGTYPGSMGRYIGVHKNLSMLTVELKHAGIMPSKKDIDHIWVDIIDWIDEKVVTAVIGNEDSALQAIRHEINGETKEIIIDKKAGD